MERPERNMKPLVRFNDPDFIERFLDNNRMALTNEEVGALLSFLEWAIAMKYSDRFSESDISELAGDALGEVYKARGGWQREARLTTWMIAITHNVAHGHLTKHYRKYANPDAPEEKVWKPRNISAEEREGLAAVSEAECPGDSYREVRFWMLLSRAMEELTVSQAEAFRSIEIREDSYEDYASKAGISPGAARSRVSDAKRVLRKIYAKEYEWDVSGRDDGRQRRVVVGVE